MAGNVYDIVVLSSSPPVPPSSPHNVFSSPRRQRVAMPPSSPVAFSPLASPKKPTLGASKPRSRGAPIPDGAVRGFATVGSLVRSEHFTDQPDDEVAKRQQPQSRQSPLQSVEEVATETKKPRKRPVKKPATEGSDKPKPRSRARKPRADKADILDDSELRLPAPTKSPFFGDQPPEAAIEASTEVAPGLTKSGKPRKPRAKKQTTSNDAAEAVQQPRKPRVTKPKGAAKSAKTQREDASVVSAHFRDEADKVPPTTDELRNINSVDHSKADTGNIAIWEIPESPQPKQKAAREKTTDVIAEGLDLEEAVSRRRDWTPPRDSAIPPPLTNSAGKENQQVGQEDSDTFTNMLSNFAYAQSPSVHIPAMAKPTTKVTTAPKRRRVELIQIPNNQTISRDSSPEKKAPKKKARTITDLVTGQYAPREPSPDLDAITSNFFEPRSTTTKIPLNDVSAPIGEVPAKKPPRKRNSSKSGNEKSDPKPRSRKGSAKSAAKPKPIAEVLLSPSSALGRMNKQDIMFGTSSQLALEESPTMIRQIQAAMKQSEDDLNVSPHLLLDPPPRWPKFGRVEGRKGLWAVSARDEDGGLLEHMEDAYIPEPDRTQDIPLLMDGTHNESDELPPFVDIDDIDPAPTVVISSDIPTPPKSACGKSQGELGAAKHTLDVAFDDIDDFEQEPPPSNQNVDSQHSFVDIDDFELPALAQSPTMAPPKLGPPASTTSSASPKKRRSRPAKMQSAISAAAVSSTATLKASSSMTTVNCPELLPPSTPPKSSNRFIDIEEILDSEDEALEALSPTPPRTCKFHDVPPLPLVSLNGSPSIAPTKGKAIQSSTPTPIFRMPTTQLEWLNIKPTVFESITAHVRSMPPTTDPKRPSWHEKILMYDPIVLEDFTAYLNANTNIRVYKKATQKQAKAWNQERKVAGEPIMSIGQSGEDVLAVKKELETYMVQGWCESMSVCCIWGEGRGKGGARKGLY